MSERLLRANRRSALRLTLAVIGMFGFGYALVPLYNVLCELTGLNGKTRNEAVALVALEGEIDQERLVTVEFIAMTNAQAPWEFAPSVTKMQVHPGEFYQTSFYARNLTDHALVGQAVPSVAPGTAARHFQKIECFCFTQQTFAAGEAKDMPLAFRIDPKLAASVSTVTLSYTFFDTGAPAAGPVP